jgi:ubiquinone/menaquinone biosynthesis C-methylase UbiE
MKTASNYDPFAKLYHKHILDKNNFLNKFVEEPGTLKKLKELELTSKKVLDLGCGSGRYTRVLKNFGANVVGVDPSEELLKIARKEIKNIDFLKKDSSNLPFKDNCFDMVFAGMVLHYVKDIESLFREVFRVLRPKGIFILTSHVPYLELVRKVKFENKSYYEFDHYFKEGARYKNWTSIGIKIKFFHHTMESVFKAAIKNSFILSDYSDLRPQEEGKIVDSEDYEEVINKSKFYLAEFTKTNI